MWERALPAKGRLAGRQDTRALSNGGINSVSGIPPEATPPFAGRARSYKARVSRSANVSTAGQKQSQCPPQRNNRSWNVPTRP